MAEYNFKNLVVVDSIVSIALADYNYGSNVCFVCQRQSLISINYDSTQTLFYTMGVTFRATKDFNPF